MWLLGCCWAAGCWQLAASARLALLALPGEKRRWKEEGEEEEENRKMGRDGLLRGVWILL